MAGGLSASNLYGPNPTLMGVCNIFTCFSARPDLTQGSAAEVETATQPLFSPLRSELVTTREGPLGWMGRARGASPPTMGTRALGSDGWEESLNGGTQTRNVGLASASLLKWLFSEAEGMDLTAGQAGQADGTWTLNLQPYIEYLHRIC